MVGPHPPHMEPFEETRRLCKNNPAFASNSLLPWTPRTLSLAVIVKTVHLEPDLYPCEDKVVQYEQSARGAAILI